MELSAQVERTRLRIARGLRLALVEAGDGDAYRTAGGTPLDGEWLGAFAQPAVILRAVSAMSVTFGDNRGASVDEYGEAELSIVARDGDRIEWVKRYRVERPGALALRYVGKLRGATLSGYWEAIDRPSFCGVFWLARADRTAKSMREVMQSRMRSKSVPHVVAQVVMAGLCILFVAGLVTHHPIAFAAAVMFAGLIALGTVRAGELKREVAAWKQVIGS